MAELFKLMFIDINIMRIASVHLSYDLIPKEWAGYKFLFREAIEQFTKTGKVPSLGVASQKFANNQFVQESIDDIKQANLVDRELLIDQLESYIRETKFELLSKKVYDLYNEGKREEAIQLNAEESKKILEICLRQTGGNFNRVFHDFEERMKTKRTEDMNAPIKRKVTLGIDKLDEISYGGADPGDLILWIMRSGVGKSTVLRWHGYAAMLEGQDVLHIQLEGGVEACVDKYDQMWTAQSYTNIRKGNIKKEDEQQIMKTLKDIRTLLQNDISVYGFKKFGEASVTDVRKICTDYQKTYGKFPSLLIVDSLDLLKSGISKKLDDDPDFVKYRLQRTSQLLKDLAVEMDAVVITATQTGSVPIEIWNNEDKVIDRNYTEGDRTLVKPYSFVFTGNRTKAEEKKEKLRIFIDKLRDYKNPVPIVSIATAFDKGRFYHRGNTQKLYKNDESTLPTTQEKPEKITKGRKGKTV